MSGAIKDALAITEKQWQKQVADWAKLRGWLVYHTQFSYRSPSGFPDLVMVRGDRIVFAELKSETGKATESQEIWLDALRGACKEVYLWRPSDFDEMISVLS